MRRVWLVLGLLCACRGDAPPREVPAPAKELEPVVVAEPEIEVPEPEPEPDGPVGRPLRVVTYNILAAKRGLAGIVETLTDLDAHLIALQEVDRNTRRFARIDHVTELASALGLHHAFARHRRYQGGEIGVALLSRFPIVESKRVAARGSNLGMLLATVQTDDGPMRVLVVHFHPTDPRDDDRQRAKMDALRATEATKALELAIAETAPTLVLGDFNARPSGPEYAEFERFLTDACADSPGTWPTPLPLIRIDYVWHTKQFQSRACPIVQSQASDHRPVIVDLVRTAG